MNSPTAGADDYDPGATPREDDEEEMDKDQNAEAEDGDQECYEELAKLTLQVEDLDHWRSASARVLHDMEGDGG